MQSKRLFELYGRLREVNSRARAAICSGSMAELEALLPEHRQIAQKIRRQGISYDPALLGIVEEVRGEVAEVLGMLHQKRDETLDKKGETAQRKKQAAAYQAIERIARFPMR